jgi:hypothetical protein
MDKFEVGKSYGVLHLDDRPEVVTVTGRDERTVTLSDGRKSPILQGSAPDGGDEEVLRLDEVGALAHGGVVRACAVCPPPPEQGGPNA